MEPLQALKGGIREKVQLATKFASAFTQDGQREIRGDPAYVRSACESSLKRLDVDCIDLYYVHRIDTRVPIEVTVSDLLFSLLLNPNHLLSILNSSFLIFISL